MATITDIYDFEQCASDLDRLQTHLIEQIYNHEFNIATHGGRIIIDVEAEYELEEDRYRWEDELRQMDNPYDMVSYAMSESPDNDEYDVWEEFCG